jgi:hypothetical protein
MYLLSSRIGSKTNTWSIELQQQQPQLYDSITKNLTPEEQQIVQGAVNQADAIAVAAQAAQATNGHVTSPTS